MQKENAVRAARVCHAGVINQAIITNVTAVLFVPFMRMYGFTYVQLGLLTAAGFAAQLAADLLLLFFIDRISPKLLAGVAASFSCGGLLFYGVLPWCFDRDLYIPILAATVVFAFAGGMLRIAWRCFCWDFSAWRERSVGTLRCLCLRRCRRPCWSCFRVRSFRRRERRRRCGRYSGPFICLRCLRCFSGTGRRW